MARLEMLLSNQPMPTPKLTSFAHGFLTKTVSSLFKPSESSVSSLETTIKLLKLSADTKNSRLGRAIHAQLIIGTQTETTEPNIIQTNSLINFYVKSGEISIARELFDQMRERNVVSCSSLMSGYFHHGLASEALKLFKSVFSDQSFQPNEYIFSTILSSCSDVRALKEGMQCHGYLLKSGLEFHLYVKNALIHMYTRCSEMEGASKVFHTVSGSDVLSYNSLINGFVEEGNLVEALGVLVKMVDENMLWDQVTYVTVLGLCAQLKDLRLGLQVHGLIFRKEVKNDVFICSAIIDMYGKCGKISGAKIAFDGLLSRTVVLWTSIMTAYAQNRCFEDTLNLLHQMEFDGVHPNEYTYAIMMNSCAELSSLRHGDSLNAHSFKSGYKNYLIVGNALINMYSKSGSIEDARLAFEDMIQRNAVTWNSMISGYSHHGLGRQALHFFKDMLAVGEVPDHVTFVGVLSACGHLGLVDEGFYYLNHLMKDFGITPGLEHYTCIVGLLAKAGLLNEAESFMKSFPTKWDVVAWRTLLSACYIQRNFSLGKRVGDIILKLDPNDVGTYILLSNMYAKAKWWDGVVNVRKLMRGRDIKKEPGISWIQVRNKTHIFVSEDKQHSESTNIYEKVGELLSQIKLLGYVPDIATVLHDVEDEQKEAYLSYHSEKLAIAFGLMNTPSAAPIHIIKNLRMCDDCHTAVKLISKITRRTIIVRDANRFHCFQSGGCSCGDCW